MTTIERNHDKDFTRILQLIEAGRERAFAAVNLALIETYWAIGQQLSTRVSEAGWGKGIVKEMAEWLAMQAPELKGFSASNLWRMKQFYETYVELPHLATVLPRSLLVQAPPPAVAVQDSRGEGVLSQSGYQGKVVSS